MKNLLLIAPEIVLSVLALVILIGETIFRQKNKFWVYLSIAGLTAVLLYYVSFFVNQALPGMAAMGIPSAAPRSLWIEYPALFNMVAVDSLAIFFKISIVASVIMILWLSLDYREFTNIHFGTYSALLLLATVGMMFLVGATDLLMAVISLELLSVTSFILAGFIVSRRSSVEAAIKYFLVGSLSTGLLLFGISYFYAMFGTTSIAPLLTFASTGQTPDTILSLTLIFIVSGLGFKLAMAPFHMWAPDTYEGAPTPITAFLSVAPKAAAIGFLLRLLAGHRGLNFTPVLAALAAITMCVGNIGALQQTNVKRLLAYSSIAQVGYILVAMVAGESLGLQAAMIYTFVYLFMNLGVFAVFMAISNTSQSDDLDTFAGLSQKNFGLSMLLLLFLISMTGIPPMAGFVGKFAIFSALIRHQDLLWLAIVAVLNSVVSLYYYFKIAQQMFFKEARDVHPYRLSPALFSSITLSALVTVIAGLAPQPLLEWIRSLLG